MIVLALDCSLDACSVVVTRHREVLAVLSEPMQRGHQERLAPMVRDAMASAEIRFDQLQRIGVTVGPGSFTGLRVALAFANALSLSLDIACVGVGGLESLAYGRSGLMLGAIDARQGRVYVQLFRDGLGLTAPQAIAVVDVSNRLAEFSAVGGEGLTLVGPGAGKLHEVLPHARIDPLASPDPVSVARLAALAAEPRMRPRPLYLREPDARTLAERQMRRDAASLDPG